MRLAEPTAAFIEAGGHRLHLYLWKRRAFQFLRLPSGAGAYVYAPAELTFAVDLPDGRRLRVAVPPTPKIEPGLDLLADFEPVGLGALRNALREAEGRTTAIRALAAAEIARRFGAITVAAEDAYSAGECWFGSRAGTEIVFRSSAPPVETLLAALQRIPPAARGSTLAACAYAAAYVVGDDDALLAGAGTDEQARAVAEGRKADGSGNGRAAHMSAVLSFMKPDARLRSVAPASRRRAA